MITLNINLNKKTHVIKWTFLHLSDGAALQQNLLCLIKTSQFVSVLRVFNIEVYLHQTNFSFSCFFSLYRSSKRIGGASLETDAEDWQVRHGRQMGKISDQGTISFYSAVVECGCEELLGWITVSPGPTSVCMPRLYVRSQLNFQSV